MHPSDAALLNPRKTAILVIDMHGGHLSEEATLPVPRGKKMIPRVKELLEQSRALKIPIIFVTLTHRKRAVDSGNPYWFSHSMKKSNPDFSYSRHNIEGSPLTKIVEELGPYDEDILVNSKRRFSAFYGTDLDIILSTLGVDTVGITGVMSEACCLSTAFDATNRDLKVLYIRDCTAGKDEDTEKAAASIVDSHLGWVVTAKEFVELMARTKEASAPLLRDS